MKKKIILLLSIILILSTSLVGCIKEDKKDNKECYINESIAFENGVEFSVARHIYKREIQVGYTTYTTDDIFLCIEVKVKNGSQEKFSGNSTDIWLLYGGTKIGQVDIVKRWVDGYYAISQSPTTTKTYVTCFELSADIPFEELALVFDRNNSFFNSEQVKILLKNNPTT